MESLGEKTTFRVKFVRRFTLAYIARVVAIEERADQGGCGTWNNGTRARTRNRFDRCWTENGAKLATVLDNFSPGQNEKSSNAEKGEKGGEGKKVKVLVNGRGI